MSILPCQKGRKKHQQNCRLSNNKGSLASAVVHNSNRLWRRDQDRTGSMASLALLIALVLCLGGRTALCDLSLKVPHETQGVRGDSVVIPCTYTPSARYTEHEVHWYADDVKIISRFDSQSHILKADFEGRLKVADTRAGDVSLTIKNLRTIERADYRCEVIWKSSDGFVTKQGISKLMVLRVRPATVRPATVRPATVRPATQKPEVNIGTSKIDDMNRGSGVPLYIILLIALVCALSICTLIIVFITRRNKNAYYSYNMPTMAQLAMRQEGSAPIAFGEYSSCACQTPQTENDYHPCKQMPETEYEVMAAQASNEYELLIPEREVLPSCSALTEPNPAVPPSPRSTFLK
uniref:Ig-like domain-containing protein n=1 Tax=Xenopus tropicalis TaxID=8364 RepID=A0A803KC36_XENTR